MVPLGNLDPVANTNTSTAADKREAAEYEVSSVIHPIIKEVMAPILDAKVNFKVGNLMKLAGIDDIRNLPVHENIFVTVGCYTNAIP